MLSRRVTLLLLTSFLAIRHGTRMKARGILRPYLRHLDPYLDPSVFPVLQSLCIRKGAGARNHLARLNLVLHNKRVRKASSGAEKVPVYDPKVVGELLFFIENEPLLTTNHRV